METNFKGPKQPRIWLNNTSICEAECQIDIGLFLDEYPRWEIGNPHRAIILHEMFLHTTDRGRKRQNKWSAGATVAVCMTLVLRQTNLPWS